MVVVAAGAGADALGAALAWLRTHPALVAVDTGDGAPVVLGMADGPPDAAAARMVLTVDPPTLRACGPAARTTAPLADAKAVDAALAFVVAACRSVHCDPVAALRFGHGADAARDLAPIVRRARAIGLTEFAVGPDAGECPAAP